MHALLGHFQEVYWPVLLVLWPSLVAAFSLAVAGAVLGTFVVLRRETLVVLSIPQLVTLGAAVGLRLGWPTLPPAFAIVAAAMVLLSLSGRRGGDQVLLPALYIAGACFTILLVANSGQHLIEVQNLFSGIDVAVGDTQAVAVAVVMLLAAGLLAALWTRWLLIAQSPEIARLSGVNPTYWNWAFLSFTAGVLVVATWAVGNALVVALVFLPAATALRWQRRIPAVLLLAVIVGCFDAMGGTIFSVEMGWPLSQSIGGFGVVIFMASHLGAAMKGA